MRVRQDDDDPRLFAPDPVLRVWRGWFAFVSLLPLLVLFVVGMPTVSAIGVLWATGGWEHVASVWSERHPAPPSVWAMVGLIIAGSVGGGLASLVWHALFVWSGFVDERAFERYFDLTKPGRLVQAVVASTIVGGVFVWLLLKLLPA